MKLDFLRRAGLGILSTAFASCFLNSCLVERTVTDGQGNLIYQEPEVRMPFESEEKKRAEVVEKERELGW